MTTVISRVFRNGNSQAVRIPQEFRLETDRVEISRNAQGDLIIRPVGSKRGAAVLQALSGFDDDFAEVLGQFEQTPMQEREDL